MKHFPRRLLSAILATATAASLLLTPLAAVIGSDLLLYDTDLHNGTTLSHGVFWGASANDKRTENYIHYTPNPSVRPIITYGDKMTSLSTVSAAAEKLEQQGLRVVAGINGDFYYTSNGVPMGLLVTDGILRTGYNLTWAVGFMEDGTAIMGDPRVSMKMTYTHTVTEPAPTEPGTPEGTVTPPDPIIREETVTKPIYTMNKPRGNYGIYLYTNDFNSKGTTGTTEPGIDVVLTPADGSDHADLRIGQSLVMTVESVQKKSTATPVPAGKIVLSINSKAPEDLQQALLDLTPGTAVTISITADNAQWANAKYITSAYKKLVVKGEIVQGLDQSAAPRTAIGMKEDGSLIFYTIDGRQSGHSVGASEYLLAQRMQQLGCVTALVLDGGGSTTMNATLPDSTSVSLINRPSSDSQRKVSTHLFLVADNTPSGVLDHYYIPPVTTKVLAGARVQLTGTPVDTNFIPMTEDTTHPVWSADAGTVSAAGLYTAGSESGTATVTLSNGSESGTVSVETVANPDYLVARTDGKVLNSLTTSAGKSYPLVISAVSDHLSLISQSQCFHFSVEGNIGSITPTGVFTAERDGKGAIVISAGTTKLSIPVTVQSMPFTDVPLNAWYYNAVQYVYDNDLMNGTDPTRFSPSLTTTRAMLVQVLYNKEGRPAVDYAGTFTDVPETQWYAPAVEWAYREGIANGTGNGKFSPNAAITREQLAVMLYHYAVYAGSTDTTTRGDTAAFTDAADIHSWASDAVEWAVGVGVLKGNSNLLRPRDTATRAEIAQVLQNFSTLPTKPVTPPTPADPASSGEATFVTDSADS